VKKALYVLLVVVVLFTGMPVLVSMSGMATCPDCGPAISMGSMCAMATLAIGVGTLALLIHSMRRRRDALQLSLHSFLLERPPRLA